MQTSKAAIGRWGLILNHYGLPPISKRHYPGECPLCGKKGKFRVDDKDGRGTWICVCGAGDGFKLLQEATGKDFPTLAKEVDSIIGNNFQSEARQPTQGMDAVKRAKDRFLSLPKIKNTDAERYFNSRGIYQVPARGSRYSHAEYDKDAGRSIPCIYSIASNEYGEPVFKHLTYIENGKKADVPVQRKMIKLQDYDGSVAVKLFESKAILGIGEGIESCMSAASIYHIPTWATLSASLMAKFRAPTGVRTLYIFSDNDKNGTGLAAAFACGKSNILSKNDVEEVVIRWPKNLSDFNDMITEGDDVCEWRLSR